MFPDIANVLCIRDALWRHRGLGSASIMVGAGFSRNADPVSVATRAMPTWAQMTEALCLPLYPMDDVRRKGAMRDANGTSGFLKLAQEYQIAFGVSSLNDRIRNLVPDLDYRPGDLHKRLLRLPWADVFSTNWDTLLERSCADVFDRSYDIVRTMGEIPFTARPRIVKLHGSFPGHEPFVFTEEEYRTYPTRFAPFVNLVQQSMMETIFCLLGFSGDDPNFLHWSGWVRDNLKEGAPKIYLVGWLELSNHRRRMLEARNVMPIDLSALPNAQNWPHELRHRYASEWFISALELGKPPTANHWPSRRPPPDPGPPYLGSVPPSSVPSPKNEPFSPPLDKPQGERTTAFRETIEIWSHNRKLYPGWVVAPEGVRSSLEHVVLAWMSEFYRMSELSSFERLKALSELAWRMDRALLPFPTDLESEAYKALDAVDLMARTVGGEAVQEGSTWNDVMAGSNALALALSRNGRHAGDQSRFEKAKSFLSNQANYDPRIRNALQYEDCCWDIATGDLKNLMSRLESWSPGVGESIWNLRKAGLLAEMREDARACSLLESTLVQIRRARHRDTDDFAALSLEGWAMYLALAYSSRSYRSGALALPEDMPEPFERWRALSIVDCDAFSEYRALAKAVETATPDRPEFTITRSFDLDRAAITRHLRNGPSPAILAGYQIVFLAEITGIPGTANHVNLFEDGLRAASRILASDEPWLVSQLAIRLENDKIFDDVFSRARIARLPPDLVCLLHKTLLNRLSFALPKLESETGREISNLIASAIEVLSRVAVRLDIGMLRDLYKTTLNYYRSPTFRRMSIFLAQPLSHLLVRVIESMPSTEMASLLHDLFDLPLPDELGVTVDGRWRDPVVAIPERVDAAAFTVETQNKDWRKIISHLLTAASGDSHSNREAAIVRLFSLMRRDILTFDERSAFGLAIWSPSYLDANGIPRHLGLQDWTLLELPEDRDGHAEEALLRLIASLSQQTDGKVTERLAAIGLVWRHLGRLRNKPSWPPNVETSLQQLVHFWAADRSPTKKTTFVGFFDSREDHHAALRGVAAILPDINVDDELAQEIWAKVDAMDSGYGDARGYLLYPRLARLSPLRAPELIDRLRRALVSDDTDTTRDAVSGVYAWLSAAKEEAAFNGINLGDLTREVGIGIAARRTSFVRAGLELAAWLFRDGPEELRKEVAPDCEYGLRALLDEATYEHSDHALDVPSIRAASFKLASTMARAGFNGPAVERWLLAAKDDPLPEVRNADAEFMDK